MISPRSLLAVTILGVSIGLADAKSLQIETKNTYPIQLNGDAVTVIIGDTDVADVTAPSERLVLLTGIGPGATNLLVLDANNNEILKTDVVVSQNNKNVVVLRRGAQSIERFICTPECSPQLVF